MMHTNGGTNGRHTMRFDVDLSQQACPSCGRTDRWEGMHTEEEPGQNPSLIVWCDCGLGELKIVVE